MQCVAVTPGDIRRQMEAETPGGADGPKTKEKSPEEQIQAVLHLLEQIKHRQMFLQHGYTDNPIG